MKISALAVTGLLCVSLANAAGPEARVFAPGVVSTGADEGPFGFTPDGLTIYFSRFTAGMVAPKFFVSHLADGHWSEPREANLPDGIAVGPLCFSPDGGRLFYTHAREGRGRASIWVAERKGDAWNDARPLGGVFEKWDADQASPSLTADGTLYFTSNHAGGAGGWDIYRSRLKEGQYQEPELLAHGRFRRISTALEEISVAAAPDGSFLVFSSTQAPNGLGGSDLYLAALPAASEGWEAWPWNLGGRVNSPAGETDARLSGDGKRLHYLRSGDIYEVELETVLRPPAESAVWKPRGDVPTPRNWPQAAVANGRIYLYGGFTGGFGTGKPHGWCNQVESFDPESGSWSTLAAASDEWKQATLVAFDNRLFLFRRGGPGVAEYSPASKQWEVKVSKTEFTIPEAWPFQTRTVVLGRKAYTMYVAYTLQGGLSYLVEYDFDTGTWTPRRSPVPCAQLVAFEGRLYGIQDQVSVYDPAEDQWAEAAGVDMPHAESGVVVHNAEIWLIGGHGARAPDVDGDVCPTVLRFDPQRNTWSHGPALPWLRAASAAASVNGRLFVLGGLRPGTSFTYDLSVLEYVPEKR